MAEDSGLGNGDLPDWGTPPTLADMSELTQRVGNLESDMGAVKAGLGRIESAIVTLTARFDAAIPHLATKEDVAGKPGYAFVVGTIIATVIGVVGLVFAAITLASSLQNAIGG